LARAAEERAAAADAPNPSLAKVHEELAAMYERQAREAERAREFALEAEPTD
jgi:hypothetical protein